jgi:hypothetical protein
MCGFAGISLIASCFVKRYALDQALKTEQGFRDGPLGGREGTENDLENSRAAEGISDSSSDEKEAVEDHKDGLLTM